MFLEKIETYYRNLNHRAFAYNRVFDKKSVHVDMVLKDLARFCRANESTFNADPRLHAVLEGRREVWLRIQEYLNLSVDQLYELHKVKEIIPKEKPRG